MPADRLWLQLASGAAMADSFIVVISALWLVIRMLPDTISATYKMLQSK
jgi:hypothetical protein